MQKDYGRENEMPTLPQTAIRTKWALPNGVYRVLHSANDDHSPNKAPSNGDAQSDRAAPSEPWPGCRAGVRRPEAWETPLSVDEVSHAVNKGLI
jgi:hypothetical protein